MSPRRRTTGAKAAAERIVLRGPPDRLDTLLPAAAAAEPTRAASASLVGTEVRALRVRPLADARRVTLRLPRSTPPGTYEGSAEIEGRTVPIVAEVEARPLAQAEPRRLVLEAAPGETATVDVTLVNTGNVPLDVSEPVTFCLFDGRGLEHAAWAALSAEPPKGRQRLDVFLDDLAESHGGLVTLKPENGKAIAAGESRALRLQLRFSDRLRPGKRYAGAWRADGIRIPFRVTTPEAKPASATRRKAR